MKIRFWGVRGSIAAPQLSSQIKSKISAVLERVSPEDLVSQESRERFLAGLPPWLFGTVGGNSPCVALRLEDAPEVFVFDAGSGIRELGAALSAETPRPRQYRIFFSHFHWDHIMGLPFFIPAYDPQTEIDFYSPAMDPEEPLRGQMKAPYFPIPLEAMAAKKTFHHIQGPVPAGSVTVTYKKMNHPGGSYSYKVDDGKRRFIYATDTGLSAADFIKNEENTAFFSNADLIVIDAQYTLGEAIEKYNWGHSAFSIAVDFAANWGIKHMALFHHDPGYDDRKLFNILQSAGWYAGRMNIKGLTLSLAQEGQEIAI